MSLFPSANPTGDAGHNDIDDGDLSDGFQINSEEEETSSADCEDSEVPSKSIDVSILLQYIERICPPPNSEFCHYKLTQNRSFQEQIPKALRCLKEGTNSDIASQLILTRGYGFYGDNTHDTTVTLEEAALKDVIECLENAGFEICIAGSHKKGLQVGRVRDFDVLVFPPATLLEDKVKNCDLGYFIRAQIAELLRNVPRLFSDEVKDHNEAILKLKNRDKIIDLHLPGKSSTVSVDFVPAIRDGIHSQVFSSSCKKWTNTEELTDFTEEEKLLILAGKFLKRLHGLDVDSYTIERFIATDKELVGACSIDDKFTLMFTKLFGLSLPKESNCCVFAHLLFSTPRETFDKNMLECIVWAKKLYQTTHEQVFEKIEELRPTELPGDVRLMFGLALSFELGLTAAGLSLKDSVAKLKPTFHEWIAENRPP